MILLEFEQSLVIGFFLDHSSSSWQQSIGRSAALQLRTQPTENLRRMGYSIYHGEVFTSPRGALASKSQIPCCG